LFEEGADPNAKDSDGFTPLHCAAVAGHIGVIGLLLECGADESTTNSSGKSARDLANENKHVDVAALLVDSPVNAAAFFLKQEEARKRTPQGLPVMEERCKGVCEVFEARVELHSPGEGNRTWSYRRI
jgi:ankyrin repeat protein